MSKVSHNTPKHPNPVWTELMIVGRTERVGKSKEMRVSLSDIEITLMLYICTITIRFLSRATTTGIDQERGS